MTEPFSSNADLYSYLTWLRDLLLSRGAAQLADLVGIAARFASGMSTEFLGEARIALLKVQADHDNGLNDLERQGLHQALAQLDRALDRRV
jgi:hypothetical protein